MLDTTKYFVADQLLDIAKKIVDSKDVRDNEFINHEIVAELRALSKMLVGPKGGEK